MDYFHATVQRANSRAACLRVYATFRAPGTCTRAGDGPRRGETFFAAPALFEFSSPPTVYSKSVIMKARRRVGSYSADVYLHWREFKRSLMKHLAPFLVFPFFSAPFPHPHARGQIDETEEGQSASD